METGGRSVMQSADEAGTGGWHRQGSRRAGQALPDSVRKESIVKYKAPKHML